MRVRDLFSQEDLTRIEEAIASVEKSTSGEIRVHLTRLCKNQAITEARNLFGRLNMHKTKEANGVLIYVALESKKAAVWCGTGLQDAVEEGFWNEEIDKMTNSFAKQAYTQGVIDMIQDVGRVLHKRFPTQDVGDNELSNEVSIDDDEV